jgi:hypothetical protein
MKVVCTTDEEGVEVLREEVVQEKEVAGTPGEHLTPEAHAEPVTAANEDRCVSNVEPDPAVDAIGVDVTAEAGAGDLVSGV